MSHIPYSSNKSSACLLFQCLSFHVWLYDVSRVLFQYLPFHIYGSNTSSACLRFDCRFDCIFSLSQIPVSPIPYGSNTSSACLTIQCLPFHMTLTHLQPVSPSSCSHTVWLQHSLSHVPLPRLRACLTRSPRLFRVSRFLRILLRFLRIQSRFSPNSIPKRREDFSLFFFSSSYFPEDAVNRKET